MNSVLLASLLIGAVQISTNDSIFMSSREALTGLLCGLALIPFYAIRWMGAGDVKFFCVLGFLLGAKSLLPIWIGASLLAGLHAAVVILSRSRPQLIPLAIREKLEFSQHKLEESKLYKKSLEARNGRVGTPYAAYLSFTAIYLIVSGGLYGQ